MNEKRNENSATVYLVLKVLSNEMDPDESRLIQ
jgi:hypothetical protein